MTEFLHGVHGPNRPWTEADARRAAAAGARVVTMLWTGMPDEGGTHHTATDYELVERYCPGVIFVLRVGPSRVVGAVEWGRYFRAAWREVPSWARGRIRVRVLNEPNHPDEGDWSPEAYAALLIDVGPMVPDDVPLLAAPITIGHPERPDWRGWWERFVAACGGRIAADAIAVNAYAHLVGDACGYFGRFGRPVEVAETGTLALPPGEARAEWFRKACERFAAAGFVSAQAFIVDGDTGEPPAWDGNYRWTDAEAEAVGRLWRERGPVGVAEVEREEPGEVVEVAVQAGPTREEMEALARAEAVAAGVPPDVFVAQLVQESGLRHHDPASPDGILTSPAGAKGVGQFMPQFWPEEVWRDPVASIKTAAAWDGENLRQHGNVILMLVEYNGGDGPNGAVAAWKRGAPFAESVAYVDAILGPATIRQFEPDGSPSAYLRDLGFPAEWVASACAPIALAGACRLLGLDVAVKDVLGAAPVEGWTPEAGMGGDGSKGTGPENFARLCGRFGVAPEPIKDSEAAGCLWQGFPVVVSTPHHYYLAQRASRQDADLLVANTGLARAGGSEWLSLPTIRQRDGGINGLWVLKRAAGVEPQQPQQEPQRTLADEFNGLWKETEELSLIEHRDRAVRMQGYIGRIKRMAGVE